MTDDPKPMASLKVDDAEGIPTQSNSFYALADLLFQPLKDDDEGSEHASFVPVAAELTEEHRSTLERMGAPPELIAKFFPETSVTPASEEVIPTKMATTTVPHKKPVPDPLPETLRLEFEALKVRMLASEKETEVSLKSNYRKTKVLGRGGQGIVYLAESLNEDNLSKAMKVFSPDPYGSCEAYYEDMDRMSHVASLVSRIPHDNLLIVERFASYNELKMMIMRWIDGHDLRYLVQPRVANCLRDNMDKERWELFREVVGDADETPQMGLKPGVAVNIIEKSLRALIALHDSDIVHGDIKLENIMLDCFGSIRLIDIGSAFELKAPPQHHTWTPLYAAPETLRYGIRNKLSDLASLGYVLIELLSGKPLMHPDQYGPESTRTLDAKRDRALYDAKMQLPDKLGELLKKYTTGTSRLMTICQKLIHPDPSKRFPSAQEALEGPNGTYQFLRELMVGNLGVHYASENGRWLRDVMLFCRFLGASKLS